MIRTTSVSKYFAAFVTWAHILTRSKIVTAEHDQPEAMGGLFASRANRLSNFSESGAFSRSLVAYQPGTLLPMELHLGESRISVEARVIRSQGPSLQSDVRIGVHFELDSESRVALRRSLPELAPSDRVEVS